MLDLILSWAAELFADTLNLVITLILPIFGFTFDSFARAFPFAATAYGIFQRVALAIILLVSAGHMIPFLMSWFGIRTNELKSTPLRQLFQSVLAVIMVYYGNYLMAEIIDIAQYPFNALLRANDDPQWSLLQFDMSAVTSALSDLFFGANILIYLILLLMLGFNLIKVLLEAVERYVVLFILIYLSPLAAASLASEETSGIYRRFFVMFLSQCLLLLLNVWTIKMAISMFSNLGAHNVPMIGLLMGYAFLRISLRMDSYVNQLGLNAAVTGAGLGMELMAAGATALGGIRALTGGIAGGMGSGSSSGSPILGLSQKLTGYAKQINPVTALGDQGAAVARGAVKGVKSYVKNAASGTPNDSFMGTLGSSISFELNGTDNMISRMGNAKKNADAVSSFSGTEGTPVAGKSEPQTTHPSGDSSAPDTSYNEHQRLVSRNPHSAANVMSKFEANGYSTSESKNVSAVLEGIGARNASPALKNFIDVGNGTDKNIRGTPNYTMNKDGITASYNKNGTTENLELRNASQYGTLNANEQKTFQQFKAKNGDTYYYRTSSRKGSIGKPRPKPETSETPGSPQPAPANPGSPKPPKPKNPRKKPGQHGR